MIDIVVTYVYERDKTWAQEFKYWKDKEIREGKTNKKNRQAFGEERTREWDMFKYWFRGIEQNCPWINKVFLIVQNKNHLPKWLNKDNPKLRIVYHNEFIPSEYLPTFNSTTIQMYLSNINDLSENYIICDDDCLFLNPIPKETFFKNNKPVHWNNEIPYEPYWTGGEDGIWWQKLNNTMEFIYRITNKKIKYAIYHLPEARIKSFEKEILNKYGEEIRNSLIVSKFRNPKNLACCMFTDLLKIFNKVEWGNPYKNSCYCCLKSNVNFNEYSNKDIVCFNDTQALDDYNITKKKLIDFLENKFPNKSSYEV